MSGVHVLADGNPRQGGMDEDERDQCIHGAPHRRNQLNAQNAHSRTVLADVVSWFQRKAKLRASTVSNSGAALYRVLKER